MQAFTFEAIAHARPLPRFMRVDRLTSSRANSSHHDGHEAELPRK